MEIKKKANAPSRGAGRTGFARYGALAAAMLLVLTGVAGVLLNPAAKGGDGTEPRMTVSAAAAPQETVNAGEATAEVLRLENYEDLYALMMETRREVYADGAVAGGSFKSEAAVAEEAPAADEPAASSSAAMDRGESAAPRSEPVPTGAPAGGVDGAEYSGTNTQVRGVDEADIVKTDGQYIYYLTGSELIITRADGENSRVLSRTDCQNVKGGDSFEFYSAQEMFLYGDRIVVILGGGATVWARGQGRYQENSYAAIFDVTNRARPKLLETIGQSGYYVSSRLVDGYVYLVTSQYVYDPVEGAPITYCPAIWRDGAAEPIAVSDIVVNDRLRTDSYTVVSSINVLEEEAEGSVKAVLGNAADIYCNTDRLLVAGSGVDRAESGIQPDETGKNAKVSTGSSYTQLVLFSLDGGSIHRLASGRVDGSLLNQFAMDEYEGVFRIVTTVNRWKETIYTDGIDTYEWEDENYNCLYTLNDRLEVIGSLEKLAEDEWVESVRFDGDVAYFVTFRQTDPLFTVDLSRPEQPRLLSVLKIPGFSEYLHLFSEGRLLGLGYDADEDTGWRKGVKLTMFDTTDKADVKELHTKIISADWTPVGSNHKAILVHAGRNIIAFPADDCYYVFSYSDGEGFVQQGKLRSESGWGDRLRGLFIGELLYICSETGITVISLSDYAVLHTLTY